MLSSSLFLMIVIATRHVVAGQVVCYTCAWSLMELPSTQNVSDVCTPKNFKLPIHTEICPFGCLNFAFYEPPDASGIQKDGQSIPLPSSWRVVKEPAPNMTITFYLRSCSKNKQDVGCENSEDQMNGFYKQECYCATDLCNGESISAAVKNPMLSEKSIAITILCFLLQGVVAKRS